MSRGWCILATWGSMWSYGCITHDVNVVQPLSLGAGPCLPGRHIENFWAICLQYTCQAYSKNTHFFISINPLGTLRTNSKWIHQFYFILIGRHIEDIFKKSFGVSFINLLKMHPQYTWATYWGLTSGPGTWKNFAYVLGSVKRLDILLKQSLTVVSLNGDPCFGLSEAAWQKVRLGWQSRKW